MSTKVKLKFRARVTIGNPNIQIYSRFDDNMQFVWECKDGDFTIETTLALYPVDTIYIKFDEKIHNPIEDTWCEILEIEIDDINMQHFIFNGRQYPRYDADFYESFSPPDYYQPGTRFYHNGVFEFPVKLPIWKYMMEQYYV